MKPQTRRENLVIEETEEGLVIYDLDRHHAHTLNRPAALIFKACDGMNDVGAIARDLTEMLDQPVDERVVIIMIQDLESRRLLEMRPDPTDSTRREVLKQIGRTAASISAVLPVITTLHIAPPAVAMSQGCVAGPLVAGEVCAACGSPCGPGGTDISYIIYQDSTDCTGDEILATLNCEQFTAQQCSAIGLIGSSAASITCN